VFSSICVDLRPMILPFDRGQFGLKMRTKTAGSLSLI
jgi:hypothetical protein